MGKLGLGCVALIVVLAVIIGISMAGTYNRLVTAGQTVDAQWGNVENAYQRANRVVEAIIGEVGTTEGVPRSNVIVVSDHGFLPFDTAVSANNCSRSRWYRAVSARR